MFILGIRCVLLEYAVFDFWLSIWSVQHFQKSWYRGMWLPPSVSCPSSLYPKVLLHGSKLLVPPKSSSASPATGQPFVWPVLRQRGCPSLAFSYNGARGKELKYLLRCPRASFYRLAIPMSMQQNIGTAMISLCQLIPRIQSWLSCTGTDVGPEPWAVTTCCLAGMGSDLLIHPLHVSRISQNLFMERDSSCQELIINR